MSNPLHSMPFNVLRHMSWDRAPRVEAIALYLFPTAIAAGGTAAFLATAAVYVGVTAVTSWAINALTPRPRFGSLGSSGILVNSRDPAAAHQFVYGEMRKGGTVTYLETTGVENNSLHQIIVLAGHEVDEIGDIYINDEVVEPDFFGFVGGKWENKIVIRKHRGNQTEPPSYLSSFTNNDLTNFVGRDIAFLEVRFLYDQDVFSNGIPLITAVVKGKRVFDPRTGTTAWSDNAALCIRDYLTSEYGLSDTNIDETAFSAAANICDELVPLKDAAGNVKRYTINGIVTADTAHGEVLNQMVTACAGTLFWGTGKWKLTVADYVAPTKTLTLDDLRSGISLQTRTNLRDQFNVVQGTFINAAERWITQDYPPIIGSAFVTEDGNVEQPLDLALPFTTNAATAQRLAKLTLFRGREQMTFSAEFGMNAFDVEVGEIIDLDMDRYGFDGKEFEVIGWQLKANQDAGDLRVMLTLRETSEAAYDWNAEEQDIIANNTTLPNFGFAPQPTFVGSPTTEVIIQDDGTIVASAQFSWDVTEDSFVLEYLVEWKRSAETEFQSTLTRSKFHRINSVEIGDTYDIRVSSRNVVGVQSAPAVTTATITGDTSAPAAPTPDATESGFAQIAVHWQNPPEKDLREVQVYANTSNTTAGATLVGTVSGDTFVHAGLPESASRFYFLRSVDFTGNVSGFSASISGSTLANPASGANGDTIVTGRVFYQILQASAPATPTASSYDVATGTFTGLTANWALTQPSVDITDTTVQEWSSQFQVTIDGETSAQTISFTTPTGAIQVTTDIESDNFVTGVSGWRIQRDTGDAEFQNAIIRGTLNASDITVGTLNADRVNVDGVSIDRSAGALIIRDLGVSTGKIENFAVTNSFEASTFSGSVTGAGIGTFTTIDTITFFNSSTSNRFLMQAGLQLDGAGTGELYVIFGTVGLSPNLGADIIFAGPSSSIFTDANAVFGQANNTRVITGLPVGNITVELRGAADVGSSFNFEKAYVFVGELKK